MDALYQLLPSLLASTEGSSSEGPSYLGFALYVALILGFLFSVMAYAKPGLGVRVFTNPATRLLEHVYLFVENMCVSTIGDHGRKYVPIIMSLWMIIFTGNVLSLFAPYSPTADLSFNFGMALVSIGYVQYEGMRVNGVLGHIRHFAGPKLGLFLLPITLLLFCVELISETMKNLSLSLRLYGNIHGGHMAVAAMNHTGDKYFIPVGALVLLPLKFLTCIVQALIFTVLTCVYLSLVTHHEEEEGDGGHAAHAH